MPPRAKSSDTITPKSLRQKDVAYYWQVARKTVNEWVKAGCPHDVDNSTYDLMEVIKWREARIKDNALKEDDRDELEKERLRETIKKLQIDNADKEKKTITREKFDQIQIEQSRELMSFVTDGYKRNSQEMMNRLGVQADKIADFNEVMDGWVKAMFDAFVKGGGRPL